MTLCYDSSNAMIQVYASSRSGGPLWEWQAIYTRLEVLTWNWQVYKFPVRRFLYGTDKLFLPGQRFLYRTGKYDLRYSVCDLSVLMNVLCKIKHGLWILCMLRRRIRVWISVSATVMGHHSFTSLFCYCSLGFRSLVIYYVCRWAGSWSGLRRCLGYFVLVNHLLRLTRRFQIKSCIVTVSIWLYKTVSSVL